MSLNDRLHGDFEYDDHDDRAAFEAEQRAERIEAEHRDMLRLLAKVAQGFEVACAQLELHEDSGRGYAAAYGAATAFRSEVSQMLLSVTPSSRGAK